MKWNLKAYILGIILILFPYYIFADGFAITKSISPSNSTLGQIVTVCLSISSSGGVAKADVVWVLDVTGSMAAAIASIKNNITQYRLRYSILYNITNDSLSRTVQNFCVVITMFRSVILRFLFL